MKTLFWLFCLLTVLLLSTLQFFSVTDCEDVIAHPQFGYLNYFNDIKVRIETSEALFCYKAFFIIDFFWAAVGLILLNLWARRIVQSGGIQMLVFQWVSTTLMIASILAYCADVVENLHYLFLNESIFGNLHLSTIVTIKTILYGVVIGLFLMILYPRYVSDNLNKIKDAVKASFLSLIVVFIVGFLVIGVDQGSTVIVHLLSSPVNILLVLLYLNLLALACSHYPDYLNIYFKNPAGIEWDLHPIFGKFIGLGLITYRLTGDEETKRQNAIDGHLFDYFRKFLGSLFLFTWFFILIHIFNKYNDMKLPVALALVLLIAFLYLHDLCLRRKHYWMRYVANNHITNIHFSENRSDPEFKKMNSWVKLTYMSFPVLIFSAIAAVSIAYAYDDIGATWSALTITAVVNIPACILFQNFRSSFKYFPPPSYLKWTLLHKLGDDLTYIKLFASTGFIGLALLFFYSLLSTLASSLTLILLYLYVYYGIVIILLKHHFAYKSNDAPRTFPLTRIFFKSYVPVLGLLFIIYTLYVGRVGNGLHDLSLTAEDGRQVMMKDYITKLQENIASAENQNLYMVASYGGGLRATAWTMLVLDEIEKRKPDFFTTTAAMSGTSGGFLGLSFYTALKHEQANEETRDRIIEKIGRHNILAGDISYLLGWDFVRELIPGVDFDNDRAIKAMREYASLIRPDDYRKLLSTTYRDYWEEAYYSSERSFIPSLIGNTTGTQGNYGVAFSIKPDNMQATFPGAVDILDFNQPGLNQNLSLSYLEATSTTERFPIFSPTAGVDKKGNFLDGGYFENSGLLSLMNFHENVVLKDSLLKAVNPKIVLIINSKEDYVKEVIGDAETESTVGEGELLAVLSTITDIDILPKALEERCKVKFDSNFIKIYLPYPITYSDVKSLLRGEPKDPFEIQKKINDSNKKIKIAMGGSDYTIPPALARVLSDPAFDYMKMMLGHPDVAKSLSRL